MRVEHKISSGDHDKIVHELGWTDQEYCDGFKRYVCMYVWKGKSVCMSKVYVWKSVCMEKWMVGFTVPLLCRLVTYTLCIYACMYVLIACLFSVLLSVQNRKR